MSWPAPPPLAAGRVTSGLCRPPVALDQGSGSVIAPLQLADLLILAALFHPRQSTDDPGRGSINIRAHRDPHQNVSPGLAHLLRPVSQPEAPRQLSIIRAQPQKEDECRAVTSPGYWWPDTRCPGSAAPHRVQPRVERARGPLENQVSSSTVGSLATKWEMTPAHTRAGPATELLAPRALRGLRRVAANHIGVAR